MKKKKEKRHDNISIIIIIIIIYASVPFFKVLLFDKCSVYSLLPFPPCLFFFFFHQIKRFFFLFLTSIPISCCCCCHSWVNCFHVINFIDGKFVTLLVHSLLFFFFVDVCYNGYGICRLFFFFSSIRLMISTLEANTYLGMQKNQKNGVVFSLFIRDF